MGQPRNTDYVFPQSLDQLSLHYMLQPALWPSSLQAETLLGSASWPLPQREVVRVTAGVEGMGSLGLRP